jgi:ABC-type arginine transport system permease subunit
MIPVITSSIRPRRRRPTQWRRLCAVIVATCGLAVGSSIIGIALGCLIASSQTPHRVACVIAACIIWACWSLRRILNP